VKRDEIEESGISALAAAIKNKPIDVWIISAAYRKFSGRQLTMDLSAVPTGWILMLVYAKSLETLSTFLHFPAILEIESLIT